jgi:hypothetical protein
MDTGSGRKILIIEDESDVADLLEMGLRNAVRGCSGVLC